MDSHMPTDIRFETSAGMAWAILDRPESLNALTLAMIDRLASWLDDARKVSKVQDRKAIYEKVAGKELAEGSIIYLYHRLVIIAHTNKLEGYTQLPDGLVRVVGVSLKP